MAPSRVPLIRYVSLDVHDADPAYAAAHRQPSPGWHLRRVGIERARLAPATWQRVCDVYAAHRGVGGESPAHAMLETVRDAQPDVYEARELRVTSSNIAVLCGFRGPKRARDTLERILDPLARAPQRFDERSRNHMARGTTGEPSARHTLYSYLNREAHVRQWWFIEADVRLAMRGRHVAVYSSPDDALVGIPTAAAPSGSMRAVAMAEYKCPAYEPYDIVHGHYMQQHQMHMQTDAAATHCYSLAYTPRESRIWRVPRAQWLADATLDALDTIVSSGAPLELHAQSRLECAIKTYCESPAIECLAKRYASAPLAARGISAEYPDNIYK
jgi:hypothetical protein